jgi:hypothetical protein
MMQRALRNRLGGLLAATAMAGAGLVATATGADAQAPPGPAFAGVFNPIKNVGNGKCLQPEEGSAADGALVVQASCNGGIAQGWQQVSFGSNRYGFINQLSGFCFDAFGPAVNGTPLIQGQCKRISNEEWKASAALPNVVTLMSRIGFRDTGFCIDVPGGQSTDGLAMQIFRCNGTLAQRWVVGFA